MFKEYLKKISMYEKISNEEAVRLLEEKGPAAYEEICKRTLGLVVYLAMRWKYNAEKNGIEIMDLINEGNYALIKTIKMYDVKKSRNFITYVILYVKSYIKNEFYKHFPYSRRECEKMIKEHKSINPNVSWDDVISVNDNGETITYQDVVGKWDDYEKSEIEQKKEELLNKVSNNRKAFHPLAKKVIALRLYGTKKDGVPLSLIEIAEILKISKERVRQIEKATFASIV